MAKHWFQLHRRKGEYASVAIGKVRVLNLPVYTQRTMILGPASRRLYCIWWKRHELVKNKNAAGGP